MFCAAGPAAASSLMASRERERLVAGEHVLEGGKDCRGPTPVPLLWVIAELHRAARISPAVQAKLDAIEGEWRRELDRYRIHRDDREPVE